MKQNKNSLLKSSNFTTDEARITPAVSQLNTMQNEKIQNQSTLLYEFNKTTEYIDALLTARNEAFSHQSKDNFKSLKKFNQLLMK
jgi:hypothetical protein